MRLAAGLCSALCLSLVPGLAAAHGPFEPLSVTLGPAEGDIVIGTSFGVLRTDDGGASWTWLCETAVGYNDFDVVPRWARVDDGTMIATTLDGVRYSTDGGCSWTRPVETEGTHATDVQREPGTASTVVVSMNNLTTGEAAIVRSTDGAATFPEVLYEVSGPSITTVRYAESDPLTLYAVVLDGDLATVIHSSDGGQNWDENFFDAPVSFLRLMGVDPVDPSIVYVASIAPNALYRSSDSGATFEQVADVFAQAFVTGEDGTEVWVSDFDKGLLRSQDHGLTFSQTEGLPHGNCLNRRGSTIYVCGYAPDGEVILAQTDDGSTMGTVMDSFAQVSEPLDCPAGTEATDDPNCAPLYEVLRCNLGQDCPNGPPGYSGCCSVDGNASPGSSAPLALLALGGLAFLYRRHRPR